MNPMSNSQDDSKLAPIETYNKKELANLYGVSLHTLNLWLNAIRSELGEPIGTIYNLRQVRFIFEIYGHPEKLNARSKGKSSE